MSKIKDIINGRSAFGIVNINEYIYAICGSKGDNTYYKETERYNIIEDSWEPYAPM